MRIKKKISIILLISVFIGILSSCERKVDTNGVNSSEDISILKYSQEEYIDEMVEKYGFSREELESVDVGKFINDYELRERDYSLDELRDILDSQGDMYVYDISSSIFEIFDLDGKRKITKDDEINCIGFYENVGTSVSYLVIDLDKQLYFKDNDPTSYEISSLKAMQLKDLHKESKIYNWELHTEGFELPTTGNYGWKLILGTTTGEVCVYTGWTGNGDVLPKNFNFMKVALSLGL